MSPAGPGPLPRALPSPSREPLVRPPPRWRARPLAVPSSPPAPRSTLTNVVPKGDKKVLLIGGDTKDLYYLPRDVLQATLVDPDAKEGLWQQAGLQAQCPVAVRNRPYEDLRFAPDGSFGERRCRPRRGPPSPRPPPPSPAPPAPGAGPDPAPPSPRADCAVILQPFSEMSDPIKCCQECLRVLAVGGRLIVVQRQRDGAPLQALFGGRAGATTRQLDALSELATVGSVQWDVAAQGTDPHAVGVLTRGETRGDRKKERGSTIEGAIGASGKGKRGDSPKGFT